MNTTCKAQIYVPRSEECENLASLAAPSAPVAPIHYSSFITGPAYFRTVSALPQSKVSPKIDLSKITPPAPLTLVAERSKSHTFFQGKSIFNFTPSTIVPTKFFQTPSPTIIPTFSQKAAHTQLLHKPTGAL